MRRSVLQAAGMYDAEKTVEEQFENIQVRIANIEEGRFATEEELNSLKAAGFDPANFDQRKASRNPQFSRALKGAEDTASIKTLTRFSSVYVIEQNGAIDSVVLPIHGYEIGRAHV